MRAGLSLARSLARSFLGSVSEDETVSEEAIVGQSAVSRQPANTIDSDDTRMSAA